MCHFGLSTSFDAGRFAKVTYFRETISRIFAPAGARAFSPAAAYAVAWLLALQRAFFACGSAEETFYSSVVAAKLPQLKNLFRYTRYTVAWLLAPQRAFFACGSKEGTFFCFGFGSEAAKTKAIKRFFLAAAGEKDDVPDTAGFGAAGAQCVDLKVRYDWARNQFAGLR
jgi:hypothetical protein